MKQRRIIIIGNTGYIGCFLTNYLKTQGIKVEGYNSKTMDLQNIDMIQSVFNSDVDVAVYCAIDKSKDNFLERNISNLRNLLLFSNRIKRFVLCSSRAIYDGFIQYENIPPIPVERLPRPQRREYSMLKYQEELECKKADFELYNLRIFDIAESIEHANIILRWLRQVQKKGVCQNEIISPVMFDVIGKYIVEIINGNLPKGTYNVCGNKHIHSFKELQKQGIEIRTEQKPLNKTGKAIIYYDLQEKL